MKRTRLRRNPPQRPAYHAEWKAEHPFCWRCGWREGQWSEVWPRRLETHEMVRGPFRHKAFFLPYCWIRTCNVCHAEHFDLMPVVRQLAYKRLHDRKHYDRRAVNRLRRRTPSAITEYQVLAEVEKLKLAGYVPEGGNE